MHLRQVVACFLGENLIQQEAVNLAGVPTGPSHQASNERQTKIIKITKNTYSKPYMYTSIWNKYYIELIIKTPVFRVFWVIIQAYNEIGRGSSVMGM